MQSVHHTARRPGLRRPRPTSVARLWLQLSSGTTAARRWWLQGSGRRSPCCCPSPRRPGTRRSTARCSRPGQGDLRGLQGHLQQRRPGRGQAAAAGRVRADPGRQRARPRPGRRKAAAASSPAPRARASGHRLRPADRRRGRLLRLVRQREGRQAAGQTLVDTLKADGRTAGKIVMINGSPTDTNAGRSRRARTACSTTAATRSPPSTTPPTGPRQGPDSGWRASHARQDRPRSASTPPTTARPAARSPP